MRCTRQWFPFHVHLIRIHRKWTFQQLHCYNTLGAVHIPFITTDRDLIASQLADDLVPKCYFRGYFLGLFLQLRSGIAFPGKQTKRRIGLSRGENWIMMKLQQRSQLILWGSLWIWVGPSEVFELRWRGQDFVAPLLTKMSLDMGCPWGRDIDLCEAAPFS